MTEKRYFSVDYDEEYYIFDSETITKKEVEEKAEYSYNVFADSLTSKEILELLNENKQLKQRLIELDVLDWIRDHTVWEQMPTKTKTSTTTNLKGDVMIPCIYDILKNIEENAEEDRALARKRENPFLVMYFLGKINACNEIKELLKHDG